MPKALLISRSSSAVTLVTLIISLLVGLDGLRRVWGDDIIRSATPSPVYLRQVARVPIDAERPGGRSVLAVAWSPDGKRLAAIFDWGFQISVFDTSTWREVSRIRGKTFQPERQLAFLSESEIVTSPSENNTDSQSALAYYNSETGQLIRELPRPTEFSSGFTEAIAVPSSRKYVAYVGGGMRQSTLIFEAASGTFIHRLGTPADSVTPIIAGGPGNRLAANVSFLLGRARPEVRKEIYLFDAKSNSINRELVGHVPGVGSLAWSPDGKFLASGASMLVGRSDRVWIRDPDPIRVWDVATGAIAVSFVGSYDPVDQLAWHPSKPLLAARSARSADEPGSAIRLWSIDRKEKIFEFPVPRGGSEKVLSFDPQTGNLVSGWGGELYIFELLRLP